MPIYEPKRTFIPGTGKPAPRQPGAFTSGFATGLGQGFNYLFTGLTNDLAERRDYKKRLEGFTKAGLTLRESESLATLSQTDPQLAGQLALGAIRQRQEPRIQLPQQQPYQGQASPQLTPVQAGQLVSGQQSIQDRMLQGLQGQMAPQAGQMAPQTMPNVAQTAQGGFPRAPIAPIATPQTPQMQPEEQGQQNLRYQPTTPQERPPFSPPPGMTVKNFQNLQKERRAEEKLALDKRKEENEKIKLERTGKKLTEKQKAEKYKYSKKYLQGVFAAEKSAKGTLRDLKRMTLLNEKNQLSNNRYVSLLRFLKIDYPSLMTVDSEEWQKTEKSFLRHAKTVFGARITNFEVDQFLQTIPSLTMSQEGKKRVIKNLEILNTSILEEAKAARAIIKENDSAPPYDIDSQVNERIGTNVDQLYNDFINGIDLMKEQAAIEGTENMQYESFKALPSAQEHGPGATILEGKTGKTYISDGKTWRKWSQELEGKISRRFQ